MYGYQVSPYSTVWEKMAGSSAIVAWRYAWKVQGINVDSPLNWKVPLDLGVDTILRAQMIVVLLQHTLRGWTSVVVLCPCTLDTAAYLTYVASSSIAMFAYLL